MKLFDKNSTVCLEGRPNQKFPFKRLICVILILLPILTFAAENAEELVSKGDSLYHSGEYIESETFYKKAIEENGATASLLYNLANACYKAGNEGYARLYLERAKRLDPDNEKINNNLEFLATRINDANKGELKGKKGNVMPDEPGFFGKIHQYVAVDYSSNSWAEMAATSFILFILALALYFFSNNVKIKKIGFFSGLILLSFSVIFVVFAEMGASQFEKKNEVILTAFKATLLSEPSDKGELLGYPLHRGTKFEILDKELNAVGKIGWYKVRLNSSNVGWLPVQDLTPIKEEN